MLTFKTSTVERSKDPGIHDMGPWKPDSELGTKRANMSQAAQRVITGHPSFCCRNKAVIRRL